MDADQIKPGWRVKAFDSRGAVCGTVDFVDGSYVKLERVDFPDGKYRWVPLDWVKRVESEVVCLGMSRREFLQRAPTERP